ncbi:MAG: polyprenyl synthetase family protein, partial [Thermoguttaceae bacterium]|nr:polyprenyl synthetase family protein [Thermoguttaceae bacterium]
AFQISDDLLDATANSDDFGKRAQKDLEAGKLTYTTLFGVKKTRRFLSRAIDGAKETLANAAERFDAAALPYATLEYFAEYMGERRK